MTTPKTGAISARDVDIEGNVAPGKLIPAQTLSTGVTGAPFGQVAFGYDNGNRNWTNVLERDMSSTTSFINLRAKQNAYTLYDASQCWVIGGCGTGEKDTITPAINLKQFWPGIDDVSTMYSAENTSAVPQGGLWFAVDVASPSTSDSTTHPPYSVCSPGNLNGTYEVWRFYFQVNPYKAKFDNSGSGIWYDRENDVGSGLENMSPGYYDKTSNGTVYYNMRPNLTRDDNKYIKGSRIFCYYNPGSRLVYASGNYDGQLDDAKKNQIYILRIEFWPPGTANFGNKAGNGKEFGGTAIVTTNTTHYEFINNMKAYFAQYPPLPNQDINLNNITLTHIDPTPPNITTDGSSKEVDNTPHGGGGCKIVCTAMNQTYGFGGFRNAIWLRQSAGLSKEYEVGYHTIFQPLVDYSFKGELTSGKKIVRAALEDIARHRTSDIWKQSRGKQRDKIGMVYRAVLEPICFIVGWTKLKLKGKHNG
jgi:hypothetical protein